MARPLKLKPEQIEQVYRLYLIEKMQIKAIAINFKVSRWTISRVLHPKSSILLPK